MFNDLGASELILLVVLAIVMFGPERIPEFARKAAKVVYFLRNVANDATTQLKSELGPEYADLKPEDLNPKTFITKHLLNDIQEELDDLKTDIADIKDELNDDAAMLNSSLDEVNSEMRAEGSSALTAAPVADEIEMAPFDDEAT